MSLKTFIRQSIFDIYRLTYYFSISYLRSRSELPLILNRRNLKNKGVEVGVWKGEFSDFILSNWVGKKLYSVDPWKNFDDSEYPDDMNIKQDKFDSIYNDVKTLLAKHGERSEIIRKDSVSASRDFQDKTLDFVYLDGRHHFEGVKEDIYYWYPKVKNGGLLCGHDYLNGKIGETYFGVKQAVDEFAKDNNYKVIVSAKDHYPTWIIVKK
ncbi:MAG: class I SAM-dependent methyltransferase [Bacteroidetes bacterium]|nr:class I SAM-dependent methyltransferase [Bacteroidota bacterium]